jgi:hypothetical protein
MNLTQFTIISQLSFSSTIVNQVNFIYKSWELIAVSVNSSIIQFYDIETLTLQSFQSIGSISNYSKIDYESANLYLCLPQQI